MINQLVLWARYQPMFVKQEVVPEIEENIKKYGILWPKVHII